MEIKIAIIGSREFLSYSTVKLIMNAICEKYQIRPHIVSGGARGADRLGQQYAKNNGLPITIYYPDYTSHGRRAPMIRNKYIIENSDLVVAFWDGKSPGTQNALSIAEELNITAIIYDQSEDNITKTKGGSF